MKINEGVSKGYDPPVAQMNTEWKRKHKKRHQKTIFFYQIWENVKSSRERGKARMKADKSVR